MPGLPFKRRTNIARQKDTGEEVAKSFDGRVSDRNAIGRKRPGSVMSPADLAAMRDQGNDGPVSGLGSIGVTHYTGPGFAVTAYGPSGPVGERRQGSNDEAKPFAWHEPDDPEVLAKLFGIR